MVMPPPVFLTPAPAPLGDLFSEYNQKALLTLDHLTLQRGVGGLDPDQHRVDL